MNPILVTNAFSINMLNGDATVSFKRVPVDEVRAMVQSRKFDSAVGHADTAAVFSHVLGVHVPTNRYTVTLCPTQVLLVGQYRGPRLPEGATRLPEGATIEWWRVELKS